MRWQAAFVDCQSGRLTAAATGTNLWTHLSRAIFGLLSAPGLLVILALALSRPQTYAAAGSHPEGRLDLTCLAWDMAIAAHPGGADPRKVQLLSWGIKPVTVAVMLSRLLTGSMFPSPDLGH